MMGQQEGFQPKLFYHQINLEQSTLGKYSRDVDSYSALLIFRSTHPYGLVYG
jgi:hypothetical protein